MNHYHKLSSLSIKLSVVVIFITIDSFIQVPGYSLAQTLPNKHKMLALTWDDIKSHFCVPDVDTAPPNSGSPGGGSLLIHSRPPQNDLPEDLNSSHSRELYSHPNSSKYHHRSRFERDRRYQSKHDQ